MKQGKKKSWLKYVLVFGLIFFVCWYERGFLAQAAEKIRKLPNWTIFIIIVLSLTYLVWEGTIIWLLMRQSVKHYSWIQGVRCSFVCSFFRTTTLGSGGGVAQMYEMNRDGLPLARGAGLSMVQYIFHKVSITLYGASGDTELFEKASNINGFQGGRVANNLYISPFRATVFKTAALFLYLNSSVVIRVRRPLFFPL